MSRIKKEKQLIGEEILDITPEIKRFATPKIVAEYRAKRLACDIIVDLCSGYGFQTFAFAKTCKQVIAVEKNPDAIASAKKYAEKLGLKNILFICGDALSSAIAKKIQKADAVFCDPERAPAEKERTLATIQPEIQKLLDIYGKITPNIALELPPHISNLAFDAEFEYISLNGSLNRLTLYFGRLKQAQKSVVLLPEQKQITALSSSPQISSFSSLAGIPLLPYSFLFEPNPALVLSGLFYEAFCSTLPREKIQNLFLCQEIIQIVYEKKVYFLSTDSLLNPFFITYNILERVKEYNEDQQKKHIKQLLQQHNAGKIVLRYSLDPKKYWKERTFFEKGLSGTKILYLFVFDEALVCEKIV